MGDWFYVKTAPVQASSPSCGIAILIISAISLFAMLIGSLFT